MRILYLISVTNHGGGGHQYSLKATAGLMAERHHVLAASIGPRPSKALNGLPYYRHIEGELPSVRLIRKVKDIVTQENIEIIHAFDVEAYWYARVVSILTGSRLMFTLCGGPTPKGYFPRFDNLILFSEENKKGLTQRCVNDAGLYLIPNRVAKVTQDHSAIENIRDRLPSCDKVILRIARFGTHHSRSILGTIKLGAMLKNMGVNVHVVIIGNVDHLECYEKAKALKVDNATLITEEKYTTNAARLIRLGDIIVGTGRGAMEAAMEGIPVLAPIRGLDVPVLASPERLHHFLKYNFSDRTDLGDLSKDAEIKRVADMLESPVLMRNVASEVEEFARKHFDIRSVQERYDLLYDKATKSSASLFDIAQQLIRITVRRYRLSRRPRQ